MLVCVLLAGITGGCALSFPIMPLASDDMPTGSVKPIADPSPLSPRQTAEDWRRARSALAVALDPVGNGSRAVWDNPATGLSGSFTPAGAPYVKADQVCRAFRAELAGQGDADTLDGVACRVAAEEWVLKSVKPRES
ncbi:hypothetical protein GCM10010994_20370 [Chelatococcus reniformis]|uniref:Surface antigen domain-containing protein n=1 Tax=Chelatococcus reniformis TaxID=1494448 RepID=A0A916U5R2_9HYPH|nr:hypothetical protein GCM10010994_20370 [Chelatococcus reniformis]